MNKIIFKKRVTIIFFALLFLGYNFAQIKPNIVFILVDDMGFGDVKAFNHRAKTTTPQLDKLAASGMMFRDAHTTASSCVPSRYSLLTGRYPHRIENQLGSWRDRPLINEGRLTMPQVLKNHGYKTAMIGKWHLGFDHSNLNNQTGGPVDRGFDYYYGFSRSLDQADYFYIENRTTANPPSIDVPASPGYGDTKTQGPFWRAGKRGSDFVFEEALSNFVNRSVTYIEENAPGSDTLPFFLYVPLASPHSPWLPTAKWRGTHSWGEYGDWIAENDDEIGKIIQAVYDNGIRENTMIFFTSDNGPNWNQSDINRTGHDASGIFTGRKFDAWEGGHRVPFIVSWPGVIPNSTTSNQLISLGDMTATFAAMMGQTLTNNEAEDSYNILPAILDPYLTDPIRETFLEFTNGNRPMNLRLNKWKYLESGELFDLSVDSTENNNVANQNRAIVDSMSTLLRRFTNQNTSLTFPRKNPITVLGCKDSLIGKFQDHEIFEQPGFCPVGVEGRDDFQFGNDVFSVLNNVLTVNIKGPHIINIRKLDGTIYKSLHGQGVSSYNLSNFLLFGIHLIEFRQENFKKTLKVVMDL